MDASGSVSQRVLQDASPRSRAAIQAALTEDFEEVSDEDSPVRSHRGTRRQPKTVMRRRNTFLSSDSDEDQTDVQVLETSVSYGLESHCYRPLALTMTVDDFESSIPVSIPSTSRPCRTVVKLAAERKNRNRQLMEKRIRQRRRRLPPLVTLDNSLSDTEENEDTKKRRAQEEADYQLALKLSAEWNMEISGTSTHDYKRDKSSVECDEQQCIICFEEPNQPVGCIHCRQMIGCRKCILKWRRTTNISSLNRSSPLSRGIASTNHRSCPLCRVEWEDVPEVAPWRDFLSNNIRN